MSPHIKHDENGNSKVYWVPIQNESPAQPRHDSLGFISYASEVVGLKHTPCPPWCHSPTPIGRGFIMATPVFTFAILLTVSIILGTGAIPWLKIIIGSLLGIPGGFGLGYLYYIGSHSAIEHFDLAVSREQLNEEIDKRRR